MTTQEQIQESVYGALMRLEQRQKQGEKSDESGAKLLRPEPATDDPGPGDDSVQVH